MTHYSYRKMAQHNFEINGDRFNFDQDEKDLQSTKFWYDLNP